MGNKIPVGATIGGAYRFAFGRFPAVVGVVWLPAALTIAAAYFLFRDVAPLPGISANAQEAFHNWTMFYMSVLGPLNWLQLVLWVAAIMIEVGLTRLALGIGGAPLAYFNLGAPFWRMLGANLIMVVIVVIAVIPFVLIVAVFGVGIGAMVHGAQTGQANWIDPAMAPWLAAVIVALAVAAFIGVYYVYLRLWFLLAPVVVAEQHIDLRPGWRLAKGNVLRILVILIAVTVPPLLLLLVAEGVALFMILSHNWTAIPDASFFVERWPVFAAIGVVAALAWLLATAAVNGARAVAYRALVPAEQAPAEG